jgi:TPR repeat protein
VLNIDKNYPTMRLAPLVIHHGLVHEALLKGKSEMARHLARPLLLAGDPSTQWYLGLMHHTGTGVEKDLAAARRWYELSAARGFRMGEDGLLILTASEKTIHIHPASFKMASSQQIYSNLEELKCFVRDTEVVFWEFQRGADLGDLEMQILLGNCHEAGAFIPAQWKIALEWYRRAGAQGSRSGLALYKKLSWSKLRDRGR